MPNLFDFGHSRKATSLQEIKIRPGDSTQVRLFTADYEPVILHFSKSEKLKGFFRCLGESNGCPACAAGLTRTNYILLPVYSVKEATVGVLRVSESDSHTSLLPQLLEVLSGDTSQSFQTITRIDNFNFKVASTNSKNQRLLGADTITEFMTQVQKGNVELNSIYPHVTAEEMLEDDQISLAIELKKEMSADEVN